MDIDLFETTNVATIKGENSVEKLRERFESDDSAEGKRARKWLENEPYAEAFAQLYDIKDTVSFIDENAKTEFVEFDESITSGYMSEGEHLMSSISEDGKVPHIGLKVDLGNDLPFTIVMKPSDRNDARTEMKVTLDEKAVSELEPDNQEKQKANKEKIRQIIEFCEHYGFSTFNLDIPTTFSDEVDINAFMDKNRPHLSKTEEHLQGQLHELFKQIKDDKEAERKEQWRKELSEQEINYNKAQEYLARNPEEKERLEREIGLDNISYDTAPRSGINFSAGSRYGAYSDSGADEEAPLGASTPSGSTPPAPAPTPTPTPTPVSVNGPSFAEMQEKMEDMLGVGGLNKERDVTYIKKYLFHSKWVEYVVYDKPYGFKEDGKRNDKTGEAQFTYAFKLFVTQEDDGSITISYRFNKGGDKKALINALVGKFDSLGLTHVNFPEGLPDEEKGLWRKALGEKGIVWVGMKLDVDKAGDMVKSAQEKHLPADQLVMYKYRIAQQMIENNAKKGKTPGEDEADFIDSYIKTYDFNAFKKGYARGLKAQLNETLIKGDMEKGAFHKIAAYRALVQVFEIYKEALKSGGIHALKTGKIENIISDSADPNEKPTNVFLTKKQKEEILKIGGLPTDIREIRPDQLLEMYKILTKENYEAARKEVYSVLDANRLKDTKLLGARALPDTLVRNIYTAAEKRASAINTALTAMGVEEIALPKEGRVSLGIGEYDKAVEAQRKREAEEAARAASGAGGSAFIGGRGRNGGMEM